MNFAGKHSFEMSLKSNSHDFKSVFSFNNTAIENNTYTPNSCGVEPFGRESLGIINLENINIEGDNQDFLEIASPTNLSQVTSTISKVLNNGFFLSSRSISNTTLAGSTFSSFNSASLDNSTLSRISAISSVTSHMLNDVFIDSSDFFKRICLYGDSAAVLSRNVDNKNKPHRRIQSLPSAATKSVARTKFGFLSENKIRLSEESDRELNKIASSTLGNEFFEDSVFIEANHLASRIENGSILELDSGENDMLDSIQEPKLVKEDVPLVIDKVDGNIKTAVESVEPVEPSTSAKASFNGGNFNLSSPAYFQHDELISNCPKVVPEILLTRCNKVNNLNELGQSSGEKHQEFEFDEVLDLSLKSQLNTSNNYIESNENCGPLDLSLKSRSTNLENSFQYQKILTTKFNITQPNKSLIKENVSPRHKSLSELNNNFKLKKMENQKTAKKEPLKARLSVNSMTRNNVTGTKLLRTPGNEPQLNYKMKKTSTPINKPVPKPVAQSTPKYSYSTTPPNKSVDSSNKSLKKLKLNHSYSGPDSSFNKNQTLKDKSSGFSRRRSTDNMKKPQEPKKIMRRSYSSGESSISSTILSNGWQGISKSAVCVNKSIKTSGLKETAIKKITNSSVGKQI